VPPLVLTAPSAKAESLLPDRFQQWFASRGCRRVSIRSTLLAKAREDGSALLNRPTGAGKTLVCGLAGFLADIGRAFFALAPFRGRQKGLIGSTGRAGEAQRRSDYTL